MTGGTSFNSLTTEMTKAIKNCGQYSSTDLKTFVDSFMIFSFLILILTTYKQARKYKGGKEGRGCHS